MAAIIQKLTRQETLDLYNQIKDVDSEILKKTIEKALLEHEASMQTIVNASMVLEGFSGNEVNLDQENRTISDAFDDWDNDDDIKIDIENGEYSTNNSATTEDNAQIRFNPETGDFEVEEESKSLMDSIAKYFDLNLKLKCILNGLRTISDPSSGFFDIISIVAPAIAQQYAGIPALIIVAAVTVFCRNNISNNDFFI